MRMPYGSSTCPLRFTRVPMIAPRPGVRPSAQTTKKSVPSVAAAE
jgi:hypothetical protein